MKVLIILCLVSLAVAKKGCGENAHFESCGTTCPLTCDNYDNPPKFCVMMCGRGCHCDAGYVKAQDGKSCVKPEECTTRKTIEKTCLDEPDPGMCRGYFPMWYFDAKQGECLEFIYGGCQGNRNRYGTRQECESNCRGIRPKTLHPTACDLPPETGVCDAAFSKYYFDVKTGQCRVFIYGGCGGNDNKFDTKEECMNTCGRILE